jgi:hypothetical protein
MIDACSKIATAHGLVIARVAYEPKMIDLSRLIKRKRPFKIGPYLFDSKASIEPPGEYGATIDGWGEVDRPALVIYLKSSLATPPWLDKYSIDYNVVEPVNKVLDDIAKILNTIDKLNARHSKRKG